MIKSSIKLNVPTWNIKPIRTIPATTIGMKGLSFGQKKEQSKNKKIRNPLKYLVEKHNVPKRYAKQFLAQPAVIKKYWKEDNSGLYVDKYMLDSIGYGWKKERKEFMETLESTEKVRRLSRKEMKKEYGKLLSKKEMEEKIKKMPKKYQKGLRKIQRVMKTIS